VIDCGSLEYAQARLQARHGQRLDEAAWRRLEVTREFTALLDQARAGALRPWLVGITQDSAAPQVEAALRGHWRAAVDEVSAWMPPRWQPALAWWAVLPDLGALQHLARGGVPADALRAEAGWRELTAAAPAERLQVLARGPLAALAPAWETPGDVGAAWHAEWRRRWPTTGDEDRQALHALERAWGGHRQDFIAAAPSQGWMLRAALRARLTLLLRHAALQPAAAFIHLALCALDLERLRAELLQRLLFPRWKVA
jgi:hypothetical protein